MSLGVNNIGGGKVQVGLQVESNIGLMEGKVKLTWSGGSKVFDVGGLDWTDEITINGDFQAGEVIGFVLGGDG